ncbi:MAG: hypothetical protein E7428_05140 [Ruminococcaceae bacterium]|nr:hypothetical protein [Oscillospiraceae bacterium]
MKLLHRNRRSKRGSSLPMVMAIGAALVIWVMALMPLMATSGTTAAQTKALEANYLSSKSSIEFVKGELTEMVKSGAPKTFAVVINGGEYASIPKYDAVNNPDSAYTSLVDTSANPANKEDSLDVPKSADVVAICAVEHAVGSRFYDITIKTYNNGEEGMTYTATYTVAGNLKIFPEAYKQVDALPLSDFVLVDGWLGERQVWTSTIESKSDTKYNEYLMPEPVEGAEAADETYANSGEYPAVFKKTAETLIDDEDVEIPEGAKPLTDPVPEDWVLPTSSDFIFDKEAKTVAIDSDSRLYGKVTMADLRCTVYYNGVPSKVAPAASGTYRVTLSVEGTGTYDAEKPINVLPTEGIVIANAYEAKPSTTDLSGCKVEIKREEVGSETEAETGTTNPPPTSEDQTTQPKEYTYTADFSGSGVQFGYCTGSPVTSISDAFNRIQWGVGDFELTKGTTYYFYCVANGSISDGVIKEATIIKYLGNKYVPTKQEDAEADEAAKEIPFIKINNINNLGNGKRYLICKSNNNGSYSVLRAEKNSNTELKVDSITLSESNPTLSPELLSTLTSWTLGQNSKGNRTLQSGANYLRLYFDSGFLGIGSAYYATLTTNASNAGLNIQQDGSYIKIRNSSGNTTYLRITSKKAYGQNDDASTSVFFVEVPTRSFSGLPIPAPGSDITITSEDLKYTYGSVTEGQIAQKILSNVPNARTIYLNSSPISADSDTILQSGSYLVHVDFYDRYQFIPAGTVTVEPQTLNWSNYGTLSVSTSSYNATLSYNKDWPYSDSSRFYYAYKMVKNGNGNNVSDSYHWLPSATIENLAIGTYTFAIWQGGDNNHVVSTKYPTPKDNVTIKHAYVDFNAMSDVSSQFVYTVDASGNVSWYRLPQGILPSRVTLAYHNGYYWQDDYIEDPYYGYGVAVSNSSASFNEWWDIRDDTILSIGDPGQPELIGEYFNSVITGRSIYFMGDGYSIDTNGANVTITTDLLVLRNGIDGIREHSEGVFNQVMVRPYTDNESRADYTLMFVVNGFSTAQANFETRTFYLVKEGTDITGTAIAAAGAADPAIRRIGAINDGSLPPEVREYFVYDEYPVLLADVAYANTSQLSRIVSGETMGWTKDGVLGAGTGAQYSSTSSSSFNVEYAVCAYVDNIAANVEYSANRIMIATPGPNYSLAIPGQITMHTRYLSIDAATMTGTKFIVKVLDEADSVLEKWLDKFLGSNYNSKTLQVEYERETVMPAKTMQANTYRYTNGSNLFTDPTANAGDLVEEFKVDNVNRALSDSIADLIADTEIQERYIRFAKDGGGDSLKVNTSFWFLHNNLYVYSNFVEFKEVTSIQIGSSNNLYLNTQEKGYDDAEYLGIFKDSSAESYHGVMLHFKNPVTVTKGSTSVTIPKGMYFVKSAECGNFVTIAQKIAADEAAADAAHASAQPYTYQYRVDAEWLAENAAYIDVDGVIQNAYVDSDILGGGAGSAQTGFSGGGMQ